MLRPCWQIVNIVRCIAAYTFEWFLNYILNLDELFQLADKCVVLFAEGGLGASTSYRGSSRGTKQPIKMHDTSLFCTPHPWRGLIITAPIVFVGVRMFVCLCVSASASYILRTRSFKPTKCGHCWEMRTF